MVKLRSYSRAGRIFVQYYDSGNDDRVCCPECQWQSAELPARTQHQSSGEFSCNQCGIALGMFSSPLENPLKYVEPLF